jgi:hypothetical protein
MNCNPTLTATEFKTIHNALWELDIVKSQLEDILKPELYLKLVKATNTIREGLKGAYQQDDTAFETKSAHYDLTRDELGLNAIWSIYEVEDLNSRHPFDNAKTVLYKDHWGANPVSIEINGLTWAALYVAANACIRDSGDTHHVYIESFTPGDDGSILVLTTGS